MTQIWTIQSHTLELTDKFREEFEGDWAAVFYILDTPVAKAPVVEWYTVRSGKIARPPRVLRRSAYQPPAGLTRRVPISPATASSPTAPPYQTAAS